MSVNEDLADLLIDHRLALLRYESGVARRMLDAYRGALDEIVAEADALAKRMETAAPEDYARLRAQLVTLRMKASALREGVRKIEPIVTGEITAATAETVASELAFQSTRIARTVGISWATPPVQQVFLAVAQRVAAHVPETALRMDLLAASDGIENVIAQALAQGASMPDAAALLSQAGVIEETYAGRMVAIVRTEIQRVANAAALATYQANADVLDAVEWLATLDSRTCLRCAPLHGQVYPLIGGTPSGLPQQPPLHPRCRCFLAPVVKSYSDLGLNIAPGNHRDYDGQPSGGLTFDQWLRKQGVATQQDILGPARYDLWRNGLPLDAFSDARGVLNLGELAARYPQA